MYQVLDLPQRSRVLGGLFIAAWHALYAKSKLVPLTPAGDISVGYYLYKSMKLFKGLITHYSLDFQTLSNLLFICSSPP